MRNNPSAVRGCDDDAHGAVRKLLLRDFLPRTTASRRMVMREIEASPIYDEPAPAWTNSQRMQAVDEQCAVWLHCKIACGDQMIEQAITANDYCIGGGDYANRHLPATTA